MKTFVEVKIEDSLDVTVTRSTIDEVTLCLDCNDTEIAIRIPCKLVEHVAGELKLILVP